MMKTALPKLFSSLSFALALSLLIACGAKTNNAPMERGLSLNDNQAQDGQQASGRAAMLDENFKLESKEKVSLKDTKLVLQLGGVRRSWRADGKGEYVDAEIITTLNAAEQRQWMKIGDEVLIGDYLVKLLGAYPFGKTNAELIVTRR
jgi:hypothetical protein